MYPGVVLGGWGYVWAAYGLTASILGGYALSLLLRLRASRDRGQGGGISEDEW
jgi:hypothetical protein